jgi:hypothetical protein
MTKNRFEWASSYFVSLVAQLQAVAFYRLLEICGDLNGISNRAQVAWGHMSALCLRRARRCRAHAVTYGKPG